MFIVYCNNNIIASFNTRLCDSSERKHTEKSFEGKFYTGSRFNNTSYKPVFFLS